MDILKQICWSFVMRKSVSNYLVVLCLLSALSSCQTIVSISQSDIDVKKGTGISVSDSQMGFFNLSTPHLSVDQKLANSCPGGHVTGVETTLLKREFIVVQTYDLHAKASCQGSVSFELK
jgi:hypothetical protein